VRATAEGGDIGGVVLTATGYIIPHHKIEANSKVTGRVAWIGVEKGDKVKEARCSFVWKIKNSGRNMIRPARRRKAPAPSSSNYSMDHVRKKSSRQSTT